MADCAAWLLLHGTPLTPQVWDGVRPELEAVHPVRAPRLPSPSGPKDAQTEIATTLVSDLDERDDRDRRWHVVGHSFGAEAIPGATFEVLADASHVSPFLHPDALAARLLAVAR